MFMLIECLVFRLLYNVDALYHQSQFFLQKDLALWACGWVTCDQEESKDHD